MKFETFIRQSARVNDATVAIYVREAKRFQGFLGTRPLTADAVVEYQAWLATKFKANSLTNKVTGVNLYLRWKGTDLRIRRPPKEFNPRPRTIADKEYRDLVARIADPMERLAVRLSHDAGWSPSDIVAISRSDVDLGDVTVIRKVRQKTRVVAAAVLEKETADELRAYLDAHPDADYIFPGDHRKGMPHRNRTWVNAVLKRHGATFTPRVCRSNLATRWPGDDIKGLMTQGGWTDPKTIFAHYRANVLERQVGSFEAATGRPAKDRDPDDGLPGYG